MIGRYYLIICVPLTSSSSSLCRLEGKKKGNEHDKGGVSDVFNIITTGKNVYNARTDGLLKLHFKCVSIYVCLCIR